LDRDSITSRLKTAQLEYHNLRGTLRNQQIVLSSATQQSQKIKDDMLRLQSELYTANKRTVVVESINRQSQDVIDVMKRQLDRYAAKEEEIEESTERRRRMPSDLDDDPFETALKEKEAAVEANKVAEENLRKVSTLYKDAKKSATQWENEFKSQAAALESSREGNRKILKETAQRSDIDTLNSTIADIRHERELL